MSITVDQIKELRNATGASLVDCKATLAASEGDMAKAAAILREKGLKSAEGKSSRTAAEGIVASYIHPNGRIGVLLEINCETDYVAQNSDFRSLASEIALHIAAANPQNVDALLAEEFVKGSVTVGDMVKGAIMRLGENVVVSRFTRFELSN